MRKKSRTYEYLFVFSALEASSAFLAGFTSNNNDASRNIRSGLSDFKSLISFQEFLIGKLIVFCLGRLVPQSNTQLQFQPVVVK